jgi:hypothetical protein
MSQTPDLPDLMSLCLVRQEISAFIAAGRQGPNFSLKNVVFNEHLTERSKIVKLFAGRVNLCTEY